MKLILDQVIARRGPWSLEADGCFDKGIHLVTGDLGSGKSTLALIMAGLFPTEQGTVRMEQIRGVMLSMEFPEFYLTGLTVAEECASWGLDAEEIVQNTGLCISTTTPPLCLSRGELKCLHLSCVLARPHDLLLLDEPFSSLDCSQKERLCTELSQRQEGITVLFTHEQATFPRVDHIWEIADGRLVDCGVLPGALERWQHAPELVKKLVCAGMIPENLTPDKIWEAACRIQG
jgi:energy-coupling factor transport system ATP-binding protein